MTPIVALVVYLAAAFFPESEPRYAVFASKEQCEQAVAEVRAAGVFVTNCIPVTLQAPANGR